MPRYSLYVDSLNASATLGDPKAFQLDLTWRLEFQGSLYSNECYMSNEVVVILCAFALVLLLVSSLVLVLLLQFLFLINIFLFLIYFILSYMILYFSLFLEDALDFVVFSAWGFSLLLVRWPFWKRQYFMYGYKNRLRL